MIAEADWQHWSQGYFTDQPEAVLESSGNRRIVFQSGLAGMS